MKAALTDKSDPDKAFEEVYRWGEKYSVDMATIAGGLAAFVTNQDVNTAATAAGNAARNNALPFIAAAMAIATAYDLWSTYTEAKSIYAQEGEAGVAKYLATQGVMNIVAGKFMKAFKAGKALSKTEFVKSIGSVLKKRFKKLLKRGKKKPEVSKKPDTPNKIAVPDDLPTNIHAGQQGKHIKGHNNYIEGKSYFNDGVDPNELLSGIHTEQYRIIRTVNNQPVVDFGGNIGTYVKQGEAGVPTRYGKVHYGKKGAHIVPTRPDLP